MQHHHLEQKIGIAVSGGMDSSVLMHMVSTYLGKKNITILTVNHGLRPEAVDETLFVKAQAEIYGFQCHILNITQKAPISGIQNFARNERYRLLTLKGKELGLDMICTAHHADDQLETIFSRLLKKSGAKGLMGMPDYFYHYGMLFHRPILSMTYDNIKDYAQHHHIPFVHDPSNDNPKYERTILRQFLRNNPDIKEGLMALGQKAKTATILLMLETQKFITDTVTLSPFGYAHFPKDIFDRLSSDLQNSILQYLTLYVTGRIYADSPDYKADDKDFTFSGALYHITKNHISVFRENRNLPSPISVKKGETYLYDKRFSILAPEDGTIMIPKNYSTSHYILPFFAKRTLPLFHSISGKEYALETLSYDYTPEGLQGFQSVLF